MLRTRSRVSVPSIVAHRGVIGVAVMGLAIVSIGLLRSDEAIAASRVIEAGRTAGEDTVTARRVSRISVVSRKSKVLEFARAYESAMIAEAEVADVVPLTDHSIYLLGKKVGTSRLTVVDHNQRVIEIVEVEVTPDVDDLKLKLKENLPDAQISISSVNGGLVISGEVFNAPDVEKAIAIAKRYAPDAVTNALTIASPQQVLLEVRFVEANRTAARELGISTRTRGPGAAVDTGTQIFSPAANTALKVAPLLSGAEPFGTMLARVLDNGTNVDIMIRALEQRSLAKRLAEPNLVTTSGDTASFLAGGEFPFPISTSDNRISVEFKQFGIALAFTPTVLADGLINLKIAPEVSDIDPTTSVLVSDVKVPGLTVRRANTTVELKDGQSLAIAGLLQHTRSNQQEQLPWIGEVPILGALFRSADFQKSETDLVIIVTPHLVKPKRPGERLSTPLDGPVAANDVDFFLNGRAEVANDDRRGPPPTVGHILHIGPETAYASGK
jgi:pilus assembly protein CpaC